MNQNTVIIPDDDEDEFKSEIPERPSWLGSPAPENQSHYPPPYAPSITHAGKGGEPPEEIKDGLQPHVSVVLTNLETHCALELSDLRKAVEAFHDHAKFLESEGLLPGSAAKQLQEMESGSGRKDICEIETFLHRKMRLAQIVSSPNAVINAVASLAAKFNEIEPPLRTVQTCIENYLNELENQRIHEEREFFRKYHLPHSTTLVSQCVGLIRSRIQGHLAQWENQNRILQSPIGINRVPILSQVFGRF